MAERIQVIGPSVHQVVVARLNSSCDLFRDELGAQLNRLRGIQGQLVEGFDHLANDVDSILVKSPERCDRRENVISELYAEMGKLMAELGYNSETNIQTNEQCASIHQKLEGANNKIEGEVHRSIGSVLQRYNESPKKEETKVEARILNKPFVGVLG